MQKTRKLLSLFMALFMAASLLGPVPASANTIAAPVVTAYLMGKDGTTKLQLAQWEANTDEDHETYYDADGEEIPCVTEVSQFDNFGDGSKQDYMVYTGADNMPAARVGICTKYVDLLGFAAVMAQEQGMIYDAETWNINLVSGSDGWNQTFGKNGSFLADPTAAYYASWKWLQDTWNSNEAGKPTGDQQNLDYYVTNDFVHEMPIVLAIKSWNVRVSGLAVDSGVTFGKNDPVNLKAALDALAEKTDMENALRDFYGMDTKVTNGKFVNTGANSVKGISSITLIPAYNAITVTGGAASGTEGDDGYSVTAGGATLTSADNWFKAAYGETVILTAQPDQGRVVSSVEAASDGGPVSVTEGAGNTYSFTMPKGPVTVTVDTGIEPGNPDALVWDGTLDFRWYDEAAVQAEYHITKPAQWAALAWICSEHLGDLADYEQKTNGNVKDIYGAIPTAQNTFTDVKFYLDNDIDMGGAYDAGAGTWSGPNYYPVGSQALNDLGTTNFYGLFYGSFDGQGHIVSNVYCNRGTGQNWQSAGLFGRVGAADNTPTPDCDIVIENVAVTGYIKSGRSVGGIVGKTLHVSDGYSVTVRNCLNFADIKSSDKKGTAGIVGAGWNTPMSIDNCANFGTVIANYNGGGISGSFEGTSENCYNVGDISKSAANFGQSFGTNNGGAGCVVTNFYWLTGTSNGTGDDAAIFNPSAGTTTYEVTNDYLGSGLPARDYMKTEDFLTALNAGGNDWAFALDTDPIYLLMDGMGLAGFPVPAVFATPIVSVRFETAPDNAAVAVKHGDDTVLPQEDGSYRLVKGETYTYTASANGYVTKNGSFQAQEGTITLTLTAESGPGPGPSVKGDVNADVWDGYSIDVSWFDKANYKTTRKYYIETPAQLAGLAALVNGIYNEEIDAFAGDTSAIVDKTAVAEDSGDQGSNKSTDAYHYGAYDFNGKTVYLTADIDMSGGNYMPVGGQYLMKKNDSATKIGSSFCGVLDGQGHSVTIQADRHCSTGNYGDGQSVGLIGRLGVHDNDPVSLRPSGAGVRNLAVYGSVRGNRSVGGIVGKIGQTDGGALIENCANFASVSGTDAKGTGGIVGAAWNDSEIRNCYNAGKINNTHNAYGGIAGSNESRLVNCYNIATVTGAGTTAAIATENGGGSYVNCYWLAGTADMGVYNLNPDGVVMKTSLEMKSEEFLNTLGSAFVKDTENINKGYPVLAWQNTGSQAGGSVGETTSSVTVESTTTVTGGKASTTVTGEAVSAGIEAAAKAGEKTLTVKADTDGKDAASTSVSLPKASAQEIAKAALNLTVQAADGSRVTIAPETMASLAGQAGGSTLEITVTSETKQAAADILAAAKQLDGEDVDLDSSLVVSVTVKSDSKAITGFTGSMTIDLPADGGKYAEGQSYKVYQISADGSVEIITGTCVKVDGVVYVRVSVSHLSTFVVTGDKVLGYKDVKLGSWYYDAVAYVTDKGLMNGTGDKTFSPDGSMTRAMLVTVLYRLEGKPAVTAANAFSDVKAGQWYTDAVIWASANKIVDGYGNGLFGTNDSVTRQQMAAILYRYAQYKGYDTTKTADLSAYTDAAVIADWALDGLKWANAEGLITGRTATTLAPAGTASRAEVATILMRFCETFIK